MGRGSRVQPGGVTPIGELGAWAKKNSKTLILDDGETVEAVYQGFKIAANSFDPEKETVFYKLGVETLDGSVTKAFKSASGRAARFFDGLAVGTRVKITRHGKAMDTKYELSVVGKGDSEQAEEQEETF